jgi:hypothetical protein
MAGENWRITHSDEVNRWYDTLRGKDLAAANRAFAGLQARGPELREPQAKSLGDGLRELRFKCQGVNTRVTYHRNGNEFRTLTVFRKQRQNERNHVERARLQMKLDRARLEKEGERTQGGGKDRGQAGQNRQRTPERATQRHGRNRQQTRGRTR